MYYPEAWTDTATGTHYEKGYYDENGQRYESVAFQENGKYENVACHCSYCGSDHLLTLSEADVGIRKLQCPNCGAPVEIRSELDEIIRDDNNTHAYASEESLRPFYERRQDRKRRSFRNILIVFLILLGLGTVYQRVRASQFNDRASQSSVQQIQTVNAAHKEPVYLEKTGPASYRETSKPLNNGKILVWDEDAACYFDEESDCWLWYNTDVRPALWQYWYEDISSEFGEFGWMEHDTDGWYIESSAGNWIPLPEEYDADELWYIDE